MCTATNAFMNLASISAALKLGSEETLVFINGNTTMTYQITWVKE